MPRRLDTDTMELELIQRQMATAIMRPLTPNGRMRRQWIDGRRAEKVIAQFIKPNDRLTSLERLEIYNRQYWFRLLESMQDDYPGLVAILGQRRFLSLAEAFLSGHPSTSFTLRNLGSRLEEFLRSRSQWGEPHQALVLDMARFEWAQIVAFDGLSRPPIKIGDLLDKSPSNLRLALQPHITLLALRYPLDDFFVALKKDLSRTDASNANVAPKIRRRRDAIPQPQAVNLVAYRHDATVYFKRVEPEAFELLSAIDAGDTLEQAVGRAVESARGVNMNWPMLIRGWFTDWTQLRWFCKPFRPG